MRCMPNIRKHGVYITDEKLKLFAEHPELLDALMKSLLDATHAENLRHRAERQTLLPKADYYDAFMDADVLHQPSHHGKGAERAGALVCRASHPADRLSLPHALRGTSCPTPFPATDGLFRVRDYIVRQRSSAARTPSSPPWARACSGSCSAAARPFPTDSTINDIKERNTMKKENLYLIHGEDYLRHIEEKLELFWMANVLMCYIKDRADDG